MSKNLNPGSIVSAPSSFDRIHADIYAWHEALLQPGQELVFRMTHPTANPITGHISFCGYCVDAIDRKPVGRLYWLDTTARRIERLIDHDSEQLDPRYSPDGKLIAFRSRDAKGDLFAAALAEQGGQFRCLAKLPESVEQLEWATDGKILIALVADAGAPSASTQGAVASHAPRGEVPDWYPRIDDGRAPRRRLFEVPLDGSPAREVVTTVNPWEFRPAGPGKVVAVATSDPAEDAWYGAWLSLIDLADGSAQTLYRPTHQISGLSATGDGSQIAFVEGLASDRGLVAGDLRILDRDGAHREIKAFDVDTGWTEWCGHKLVAAGIQSDDMMLLSLDPGEFELKTLHRSHAVNGGRHYPIGTILPGPTPRVAFVMQAIDTPDELVVVGNGEEERLFSVETQEIAALTEAYGAERYLPVRWPAPDGEILEGWLHVPRPC